jgi:hypothetical protein
MASKRQYRKYSQLFNTQFWDEMSKRGKNEVRYIIDEALQFSEKDDHVIWQLRLAIAAEYKKISARQENAKWLAAIDTKKEARLVRDLESRGFILPDDQVVVAASFNHYKHLQDPIPELLNVVFDRKTPGEILDEMSDLENKWQNKLSNRLTLPYGRVAHEVDERYRWYDLERSGCATEAALMQHCGNGDGLPGQTILSLRERTDIKDPITGDFLEKPLLTFILDTETGALLEMKGFANEKPRADLHPHILSLLENYQPVKELVGGGYLPENNFAYSDLSPQNRHRLSKNRPDVLPLIELLKSEPFDGVVGGETIETKIKNYLGAPVQMFAGTYHKIGNCLTKEEFQEFYGLSYLQELEEFLEDADTPGFTLPEQVRYELCNYEKEIVDALEHFESRDPFTFTLLKQATGFAETPNSEFIEKIKAGESSEDVKAVLEKACAEAEMQGVISEAADIVNNFYDNPTNGGAPGFRIVIDDPGNGSDYIQFLVTPQAFYDIGKDVLNNWAQLDDYVHTLFGDEESGLTHDRFIHAAADTLGSPADVRVCVAQLTDFCNVTLKRSLHEGFSELVDKHTNSMKQQKKELEQIRKLEKGLLAPNSANNDNSMSCG